MSALLTPAASATSWRLNATAPVVAIRFAAASRIRSWAEAISEAASGERPAAARVWVTGGRRPEAEAETERSGWWGFGVGQVCESGQYEVRGGPPRHPTLRTPPTVPLKGR